MKSTSLWRILKRSKEVRANPRAQEKDSDAQILSIVLYGIWVWARNQTIMVSLDPGPGWILDQGLWIWLDPGSGRILDQGLCSDIEHCPLRNMSLSFNQTIMVSSSSTKVLQIYGSRQNLLHSRHDYRSWRYLIFRLCTHIRTSHLAWRADITILGELYMTSRLHTFQKNGIQLVK